MPFDLTPFMPFLHTKLNELRPLLKNRVEMTVALHRHPGIAGVMEAAEEAGLIEGRNLGTGEPYGTVTFDNAAAEFSGASPVSADSSICSELASTIAVRNTSSSGNSEKNA